MKSRILRIAVAIGFVIDVSVAILALFLQSELGPLLDVPVKDPALTTILGGELLVASCVYVLVLRDPVRYRPLLWICALDQACAVVLPAIEIARGHIAATIKTVGPMPFDALLGAIYAWGALGTNDIATSTTSVGQGGKVDSRRG